MNEVSVVTEGRVETFERLPSRFEQPGSLKLYDAESLFLFPRIVINEETRYDISQTARRLGISMPLHVMSGLYGKKIFVEKQNPYKNIETLCHAFLYAVDCDRGNSYSLTFSVPGNGEAPYTALACLYTHRAPVIVLSLAG